jgi:hypothetical protein
MLLASAKTDTGAATAVDVAGQTELRDGITVYAWGTFDTNTIELQASPDGTNWGIVSGISFSAAGAMTVVGLKAKQLRAFITGGTTFSLNMAIR